MRYSSRWLSRMDVVAAPKPLIQSQDTLMDEMLNSTRPTTYGATLVGPMNYEHTIYPLDYVSHEDYGIAQYIDLATDGRGIRLLFGNVVQHIVAPDDLHKVHFWMAADESSPSALTVLSDKRNSWNSSMENLDIS
jgi:hypothetical protein